LAINLRVTEIGEFVKHYSCERRLKLDLDSDIERSLPFFSRLLNPIDPVLQISGGMREDGWEKQLRDQGVESLFASGEEANFSDLVGKLHNISRDQNYYAREVSLDASIGVCDLSGRVDFLLILWEKGRPKLRVVECKGSRKDKTAFRIQVALYQLMLKECLKNACIDNSNFNWSEVDIESVVARINEDNNLNQSILSLAPLDLTVDMSDCLRLLKKDGAIDRINSSDFSDIEYCLDAKCDSCVKNVYCISEASRKHDLQLIDLKISEINTLKRDKVRSLKELAELENNPASLKSLERNRDFSSDIHEVILKAKTRFANLPMVESPPQPNYSVQPLPNASIPHVPAYTIDGVDLIRVYLSVDYDYVENRIGGLSAHIAVGDRELEIPFGDDKKPLASISERNNESGDICEVSEDSYISFVKTRKWKEDYEAATTEETKLIEFFFNKLYGILPKVSNSTHAPIHFYVWSRSEITRLIEACTRSDSNLLWHLQQLMGCRESLEELVFTCLSDEISRNYATAWTGKGLAVNASLIWFGKRFHWLRELNGKIVELDRIFEQDIFDFKSTLGVEEDGSWSDEGEGRAQRVEIRSRFYDSLPVPYWYAAWDELSGDVRSNDQRVKGAVKRYNRVAGNLELLKKYLLTRCEALRWLEERLKFKDRKISKQSADLRELAQFSLNVNTLQHAARDFLVLDHHVKKNDWLYKLAIPPIPRIKNGRSLPLKNIVPLDGKQKNFKAELDGSSISLDRQELMNLGSFSEGSFARLVPHSGNLAESQRIYNILYGSFTVVVKSIDWSNGLVLLDGIPSRPSRYVLASFPKTGDDGVIEFATLEESLSDFISGGVEKRLMDGIKGGYVYEWFRPTHPIIPHEPTIDGDLKKQLENIASDLLLSKGVGADQVQAICDGIESKVQLLLGPPGTGKTTTTSISIFCRLLSKPQTKLVFVSANTHRAVDNLLIALNDRLDGFSEVAGRHDGALGEVKFFKLNRELEEECPDAIKELSYKECAKEFNASHGEEVFIVGSTVSYLLRFIKTLNQYAKYSGSKHGAQIDLLIIDEAGMMLFPHFLALASLLKESGQCMLAGDHRQLAPIVAHDWENEDRPPVVAYQPHNSAYEAIQRLKRKNELSDQQVLESPLIYSFRLPPLVRQLISHVYRTKDEIELEGRAEGGVLIEAGKAKDLSALWECDTGVFLISHDESSSTKSNTTEADIVRLLIESANLDTLPTNSVAVVTPHRAQRTMLVESLNEYSEWVGTINTVEKLQGGERSTVIVSATASDISTISASAEFLLDLNRSNVAFSRTIHRLIVVCSNNLLNYIPPEIQHYQSSMLWKMLREYCSVELFSQKVGSCELVVSTCQSKNLD